MEFEPNLHAIPDDELLRRLGELDERGLYARLPFPSMFACCTEALHLSEAETYRRITVARVARKHPLLLSMLRDGRLHLSGIALLAPLLTPSNRDAVLARAIHRPKREIERLVAELAPRPDVPSRMRKLPQRRTAPPPNVPEGVAPGSGAALESVPDLDLVPGRVGTTASTGAPPTHVHHATSPPRSAARCASATATAAATSTSRADAAARATGSSSTTDTRSGWGEITAQGTSACCAPRTTGTSLSTTAVRSHSGGTGDPRTKRPAKRPEGRKKDRHRGRPPCAARAASATPAASGAG